MTKMPVTALEIRRQIFHILLGILLVTLLHFNIIDPLHIFWLLITGIILSWISLNHRLPVISWFLDKFERKQVRPGKGAITYFIGVLLALKLFPLDIALASILILAIGDGISSLVGPFGKLKTGLSDKKLFEGTLAGALAGALGALFFVSPIEAFVGAFLAMIFEAMEIRLNQQILNDNVIVPLTAGTTMLLLRYFGLA
jgi:dolichol kinase